MLRRFSMCVQGTPHRAKEAHARSHRKRNLASRIPLQGVARIRPLASAQEVPAMIVIILKVAVLIIAAIAVALAWINASERK